MQIRLASKDDIPFILNLYLSFDARKEDNLSQQEAEAKFADFIDSNNQIYIAEQDNIIIGTFTLLIYSTLVHKARPAAVIDAVVVDKNYRGQGIGKKMLQYAMSVCRERGCYKLALSSNLKWQAKDFYEKIGFKQHGLSFHVLY